MLRYTDSFSVSDRHNVTSIILLGAPDTLGGSYGPDNLLHSVRSDALNFKV